MTRGATSVAVRTGAPHVPMVSKVIPSVQVVENAPRQLIDLTGVFEDPDGDALTLTVVANSNASLVTATVTGTQLTLDFQPNQHGVARITVRATDPGGLSADAFFTVTVSASTPIGPNPIPHVPIVSRAIQPVQVAENSPASSLT